MAIAITGMVVSVTGAPAVVAPPASLLATCIPSCQRTRTRASTSTRSGTACARCSALASTLASVSDAPASAMVTVTAAPAASGCRDGIVQRRLSFGL